MSKELKHFGVLGMHWGKRKAPDHADQKRANTTWKKSISKMTDEEFDSAVERFARVNDFKSAQRKTKLHKGVRAESLSNKEIDSLLKSPIMEAKMSEFKAKRRKKMQLLAINVISGAVVMGALLIKNEMNSGKIRSGARKAIPDIVGRRIIEGKFK